MICRTSHQTYGWIYSHDNYSKQSPGLEGEKKGKGKGGGSVNMGLCSNIEDCSYYNRQHLAAVC